MPLIEKRYAEALINIAEEQKAIEEYKQDLSSIAYVFEKNDSMREFLKNPEIKAKIKKNTVKKIFSESVKGHLVDFLMLLLDKGRIGLLSGICSEFEVLADKKENILRIIIASPQEPEKKQIDSLCEKYRIMYNAHSVKASVEIDAGLIGGLRVIIRDKVMDGSIAGRLEGLKEFIMGG
ncbi:ATP synthase F1 subcomplex delta subunit [Anaerobacterium chartisolvens]|uniref:ATP synthase subunit delta n=1 Tax=Anaerobacterium chartisolvens TaxID=1297424 RepID=A0A369AYG7_9FIRM|nr:ATP synthase F1 subunit delta [Anaerobacterium chartisolvens]RCX14319.1 ATP synthase F1 subcomplex delta subunit [Anaerobacterium chartisolvens]